MVEIERTAGEETTQEIAKMTQEIAGLQTGLNLSPKTKLLKGNALLSVYFINGFSRQTLLVKYLIRLPTTLSVVSKVD